MGRRTAARPPRQWECRQQGWNKSLALALPRKLSGDRHHLAILHFLRGVWIILLSELGEAEGGGMCELEKLRFDDLVEKLVQQAVGEAEERLCRPRRKKFTPGLAERPGFWPSADGDTKIAEAPVNDR